MTTAHDTTGQLGTAGITFDGRTLEARTGRMTRRWRWTGHGFLTEAITVTDGPSWRLETETRDADWLLPVGEGANPAGVLQAVEIGVEDDEGFTTPHVAVRAEIHYPEARLALRFVVWAWPDAPGLRMQLHLRTLPGYAWDQDLVWREVSDASRRQARLQRGYQRHDLLPVDFSGAQRRAIGYHVDTQHRNDTFLDLLHEVVDARPVTHAVAYTWANAVCHEDGNWGLALLKESHRGVNQRGYDCGVFLCLPGRGLEVNGWGLLPQDLDEQWRPAWATWCLAYRCDDHARQHAFKTFDRLRYPVGDRDLYLQANTWGSSHGNLESRAAAREENVLREIDSCADLGIDVLQIDDGWQGEGWEPSTERYPQGWAAVRERAAERGIELGLWMPAAAASSDLLERHAAEGGFVSYKLDFANFDQRDKIDRVIGHVRAFVKGRQHRVRVNWDLTEVQPRYGYWFAREFGCIYLENRKPVLPRNAIYRPGTVLRDLWQVAHYCNLLKFQGSIQDVDAVDPQFSDAAAYPHGYCVAIALMSNPLFFCETQHYSAAARAAITPILAAYKTVRREIAAGIVDPIGDKPDGTRWTGFRCAVPGADSGFLMLFREPWNEEPEGRVALPGLASARLRITDLLNDQQGEVATDAEGCLPWHIDHAADFRFLRYEQL